MTQATLNENSRKEIDEVCSELDIDESIEPFVRDLYSKAYQKELYRGRNREYLIASIILIVCQSKDVPITANKISNTLNLEEDKLLSNKKHIMREIDFANSLPVNWIVFLEKICDDLDISDNIKHNAKKIGKHGVENNVISGRKPINYAVSTLYAATEHSDNICGITQSQLSEYSGVSESTIRVTYNELLNYYINYD